MRFKIIFFPLAILVCVFVSTKWIWPEFTKINELTVKKEEKQKILDSHNSERGRIEDLKKDIEENKNEETAVLDYFPVQKNEEDIVNSINYLAANSSVSLTDLSLEEKAISQANVAASEETNGPKDILGENDPTSQTRFINSKIKASGSYKNIKIFLNQIYNLPIFNEVSNITIKKPATVAEGSDLLNLEADLNFGYKQLSVISEDSALPSFPSNKFDFSYVQKIENSIVKITPISDSGSLSGGRENPFSP